MFSRLFYGIAGIDREILAKCPKTDKIWAGQLGIWLVLTFFVVFLISLHSTTYIPTLNGNIGLQAFVAGLIALTLLLFDRALYQSDWFFHGYFKHDNPVIARGSPSLAGKLIRVTVRIGISVLIAYSLSVFLELAIFSGAIKDRLEADYRSNNASAFQKIVDYEQSLATDVQRRRSEIAALRDRAAKLVPGQVEGRFEADPRASDVDLELRGLRSHLSESEQEALRLRQAISKLDLAVIAEEQGIKSGSRLDTSDDREFTGIRTCGSKCKAYRALRDARKKDLTQVESRIRSLEGEIEQVLQKKSTILREIQAKAEAGRARTERTRTGLIAEVRKKEGELKDFEASIASRLLTFRST